MAKTDYDFCIGTNNITLRQALTSMLSNAGFSSSGESKSIPGLLRTLRMVQPWLAVIDTALPPGNIEQLASIIENDGLAAAVYINTTGIDLDLCVQLGWPVEAAVLAAVAETVCTEFAHKKRLQQEIEDLKKELMVRRDIEKAKAIVMHAYGLGEEEAYRFLRNTSMKYRTPLVKISKQIIKDPRCLASLSPPGQNL